MGSLSSISCPNACPQFSQPPPLCFRWAQHLWWPFTDNPINYYCSFIHTTRTEYCEVLKSHTLWTPRTSNRFLLHINIFTNSFYLPKYSSNKMHKLAFLANLLSILGEFIFILTYANWVCVNLGKKTKIGVCFIIQIITWNSVVFFRIDTLHKLH